MLAALVVILATTLACATVPDPDPVPSVDALVGTWQVDLRPTPQSDPYFQEFVIMRAADGSFSGTFYGAEISEVRTNSDWGALRVAFITSDGSGPYNHTAVLRGDRLEGQTHSLGRDFLAYWSAVKVPNAPPAQGE